MTENKFEYFIDSDGDWSRLYVNGELKLDQHSIDGDQVLGILEGMGLIDLTEYSRESNLVYKDNEELDFEDYPDWLKEFVDEFPGEEDGW